MTVKKTPVHGDHADKVPALSRLHDSGRTVSASDEVISGRFSGWNWWIPAWLGRLLPQVEVEREVAEPPSTRILR